jgi:putative phosphoesterase
MNIGVVSDTHLPRFGKALPSPLVAALQQHEVAMILHAGDFTEPMVADWLAAIAPLTAVAGNNDGPALVARFGRRQIVTVGGVRIGLVHGDGRHGTTLGRARAAFAGTPVDAIVFGHSHQPYCQRHDGIWVVNPGSPADKRREPLFSFAILSVVDGTITPRLYGYPDKQRIPEAYIDLLALPGRANLAPRT